MRGNQGEFLELIGSIALENSSIPVWGQLQAESTSKPYIIGLSGSFGLFRLFGLSRLSGLLGVMGYEIHR